MSGQSAVGKASKGRILIETSLQKTRLQEHSRGKRKKHLVLMNEKWTEILMKRTIRYGLINGFGRLKKRCFGSTGISSFFASFVDDRIGSSRTLTRKERGYRSVSYGTSRQLQHVIITIRQHTTENVLGGERQGTRTGFFDAERKLLRDITSKKKLKGQMKSLNRQRTKTPLSTLKSPLICHDHNERLNY